MGERLNEAGITENVTSFHQVNEFNLDRAVEKFLNWTPLHAAASRGQQELLQELLSSSPELADALDSQQRSLLHLASTNGRIEIVKLLTVVRPEMCLACDRDGANPLHVAAMRGKVEVLDELFQANPHAARARVGRGKGETILHLCIKYNQLQFLSMLLKKYFENEEFVNAKDNADNTILHLAVTNRRLEIIEYVLSHTKIDVNATNASNQTAMDILLLGRQKGTELEGVDRDIHALLQSYHATRGEDDVLNPMQIADRKNGIIVAAVLMATLIFQVAVTPPGGVWQDDKDGPSGHKSGGAVLASKFPSLYGLFLYFNILGFFASLSTVALIMADLLFKTRRYALLAYGAMGVTISSIAATYCISLIIISQKGRTKTNSIRVAAVGLTVWCITLASYFLLRRIARIVNEKKRRNSARVNRPSPNV